MDEQVVQDRRHAVTLLLLGLAAALLWLVVSLFAPATSASADEPTPPEGGALGLVNDMVTGVVTVADQTVATVGAAVPVLAPVTNVVSETVQAVNGVTRSTTDAAATLVAHSPVSSVTDPVLNVVDTTVDAVPVVNDIVDATGLVGAVSATTHAVDATVGTVVSGPAPLLPTPAFPALDDDLRDVTQTAAMTLGTDGLVPLTVVAPARSVVMISAALESHTALAGPSSVTAATGAATAGPTGDPFHGTNLFSTPSTGTPGGSSASNGGGGAAPCGVLGTSAFPTSGAVGLSSPRSNDDVPSDPTFGTDSTPD